MSMPKGSSGLPHLKKSPQIDPSCFVAPGAHVIGDVEVGPNSSIWFNSVIRGDVNYIRIGKKTNVQDLSVIHVSSRNLPTIIGNECTIGHSVVLHACTIGNRVLVGMGSIIMDGAIIEDDVIIGAGSLLVQGTHIPQGSRALGRPAKVVGRLTSDELEYLVWSANRYQELSGAYLLSS